MTSMYHELIERLDMFFLATADADGRPNCSYKGGDPDWARDVLARNDPARAAPQPV